MSIHRLQAMQTPVRRPVDPNSPVLGQRPGASTSTPTSTPAPSGTPTAGQVQTPAGVKAQEIQAAQQLRSQVGLKELDAFLQAKKGEAPKQRGLVPSMMAYLGVAPKETPPTSEALALHEKLSKAVEGLHAIYQDGLVTEGELHQLHRMRGQIREVMHLADPAILQMLPRAVRERVEVQLLEPLQVLDRAAGRRFDRVFTQLQQRDDGALRARLQQPPTYEHVDVGLLKGAKLTPFSLARYQPGDFVGVPRSDGTVQKGVVVGTHDNELQVELVDPRTGSFAFKSLSAAEVARANPLKIGDYVETRAYKLWVTGVGPGGVVGTVQDARGQVREISADVVARLAIELQNAAPTQPPARTSKQSLEQALDAVWSRRADFLDGKKNVYSDIYNAVAQKNELTRPKIDYVRDLASLAAARPAGSVSNTQSFGGSGDSISSIFNSYAKGELPAQGMFSASKFEGTFFRFERPNWQPEAIKQRVYLNTAADHATDVMRFVVQQILDNPAAFPGVEMAKLSGPGAVGGRSENIVLYTHGDEASAKVLEAMTKYRALHPRHFMGGTPAFTEQVTPGIATGDEPAIGGGQVSFGSLRADIIEGALRGAKDRQHFGALVDAGLQRSQVNPQQPHKNLVVHRGLS